MRWWRLPITGSVHGPGGRLSFGFARSGDLMMSLVRRTTTSTDTDKARSTLLSMVANHCKE